jgi:hypothetical protein
MASSHLPADAVAGVDLVKVGTAVEKQLQHIHPAKSGGKVQRSPTLSEAAR